MIALADKDLVSVPLEALRLATVAPAHHGAPASKPAKREVVERQDFLLDRTLRRRRHAGNLTRQKGAT